MPLGDFELRASIAVSDIQRAAAFYEGKLGLQALRSGPSAKIAGGSRVYGSGGGPALNVYQSVTAGKSPATMTAGASPRGRAVAASPGSRTRTATPSPSKPTPERQLP
jgi:catechol 2,3-dioxygenase-like lactoylglutathione lyase family enzyme